jgi:hypothetical protein
MEAGRIIFYSLFFAEVFVDWPCPIGGKLMAILYSRYNEWSSNREKKLNLNGLSSFFFFFFPISMEKLSYKNRLYGREISKQ